MVRAARWARSESPVNAHISTCQSDGADLSPANLSCPVYCASLFTILADCTKWALPQPPRFRFFAVHHS